MCFCNRRFDRRRECERRERFCGCERREERCERFCDRPCERRCEEEIIPETRVCRCTCTCRRFESERDFCDRCRF